MQSSQEKTFIMIKPDAVQRKLVGKIIKRFELRGYKLIAMKFLEPSKELLIEHYHDLIYKPFFPILIAYMLSGPVVATVWEGKDVVKTSRAMLGETNPIDSKPGTIRGDYSIDIGRNVIHGSDSIEAAKKEISLWFKPEELITWEITDKNWVYGQN